VAFNHLEARRETRTGSEKPALVFVVRDDDGSFYWEIQAHDGTVIERSTERFNSCYRALADAHPYERGLVYVMELGDPR
jgi:hypothetical protein